MLTVEDERLKIIFRGSEPPYHYGWPPYEARAALVLAQEAIDHILPPAAPLAVDPGVGDWAFRSQPRGNPDISRQGDITTIEVLGPFHTIGDSSVKLSLDSGQPHLTVWLSGQCSPLDNQTNLLQACSTIAQAAVVGAACRYPGMIFGPGAIDALRQLADGYVMASAEQAEMCITAATAPFDRT